MVMNSSKLPALVVPWVVDPDAAGVLDAVGDVVAGPGAAGGGVVGHAGAHAAHAARAAHQPARAAGGGVPRPPSSCAARWVPARLDRRRKSLYTVNVQTTIPMETVWPRLQLYFATVKSIFEIQALLLKY